MQATGKSSQRVGGQEFGFFSAHVSLPRNVKRESKNSPKKYKLISCTLSITSLKEMVESNREVAGIANEVAKGNLKVKIKSRSDKDLLLNVCPSPGWGRPAFF